MEKLKATLQKYWPVWMLVILAFRPRRFMLEYVHALRDYLRFRDSLKPFRKLIGQIDGSTGGLNKVNLLIVAGQAMNVQWLQLWTVLGAWFGAHRCRVYALTSRQKPIQNLYLRLFNFDLIFLDDLKMHDIAIPPDVDAEIDGLKTFREFKQYEYEGIPIGKMALSTFSRQRATGIMDLSSPEAEEAVRFWLRQLYRSLVASKELYAQKRISMLFFTEVFMEEYGALYYAALTKKLNIVRFAGTVRDDAVVVQHLTDQSDRTHFSSISQNSWRRILDYPDTPLIDQELDKNFSDRYGDRWALSKRNQPNTKIISVDEARTVLEIPEGNKVAVIYSHILYDTLFFNGEDLFENYADWLVQTVKAACANTNVIWFIKVHPSNLWRGELEYYHEGKYEEVRLLEQYIGKLPGHVRLVYPDTPISPYTWMQVADFGVTVRGTSGIELGALGKTVITAGSGRYEDIGFTVNSKTIEEYLNLLSKLPRVSPPTDKQKWLARRFAYATFCMKPFTMDFIRPIARSGKRGISSSDDLVYLGSFGEVAPKSLMRFAKWSMDQSNVDFLNDWPSLSATDLSEKINV
jgi:hypothetical protein